MVVLMVASLEYGRAVRWVVRWVDVKDATWDVWMVALMVERWVDVTVDSKVARSVDRKDAMWVECLAVRWADSKVVSMVLMLVVRTEWNWVVHSVDKKDEMKVV